MRQIRFEERGGRVRGNPLMAGSIANHTAMRIRSNGPGNIFFASKSRFHEYAIDKTGQCH